MSGPKWVRETLTLATQDGAGHLPGPATGGPSCCWHSCKEWLSDGKWRRNAALGRSDPGSGGLPAGLSAIKEPLLKAQLHPEASGCVCWRQSCALASGCRGPTCSLFGRARPRKGVGRVLSVPSPGPRGWGPLIISPEAAWAAGHKYSDPRTQETGRHRVGKRRLL